MALNDEIQVAKAPSHMYMLIAVLAIAGVIGVLSIAGAMGIVAYNKSEMAAFIDNPKVAKKVVASSAFRNLINKEVNKSLAYVDMEKLFGESEQLQSMLDRSVADQLARYTSSSAFPAALASAMDGQSKVVDNSDRLRQFQTKMNLYESQLTTIAAQVNDDESAQAVNKLQGNLVELQQLINGLSEEVHCSLSQANQSKSSFLLKEKRSTNLPGYDLVIALGRIKKDVISSVSFTAPNSDYTQANTEVVGNVKVGSRLEFQSGGRNYEGLFTFRQARLGPDFVGFEIVEVITPAEGCET